MAGTAIRVAFISLCGRLAAKEQTPVILVLMLITGRADTAEQGERVRLSLKTDASFFYFFWIWWAKWHPMHSPNEPVLPFLLSQDELFQQVSGWRNTLAVLMMQKIPPASIQVCISCTSMRKHEYICMSKNICFLIFRELVLSIWGQIR